MTHRPDHALDLYHRAVGWLVLLLAAVVFFGALALLAGTAEAGGKPAPPAAPPSSSASDASSSSGALAGAAAGAVSGAASDATSISTADQTQGQLQRQAQGQLQGQAAHGGAATATGTGGDSLSTSAGGAATSNSSVQSDTGGNALSTHYASSSRALALALPGQTAAPAVAGECLEHRPGWSGLSIGRTGKTQLNDACMEFVQCTAIADRYAAWGQVHLAVEQLAQCGGVEGEIVLPVPEPEPYVTHEQLQRAFEQALVK